MPQAPTLPTVMIAIPKGRPWQHGFVMSLLGLLLYEQRDPQYQLSVVVKDSPEVTGSTRYARIGEARRALLETALSDSVDFVLFLDDDMTFAPHTLRALMAHDLDFVSALAFLKQPPHAPNVLRVATTRDKASGQISERYQPITDYPETLFAIDAAGMACCLVKTAAVRTLRTPWFAAPELDALSNIGEDVAFCRRLWEAGYTLSCDPAVTCGHLDGTREITEADYRRALAYILKGGELH